MANNTIILNGFEFDPSEVKDGWFKGFCTYHAQGKTTKGQTQQAYVCLRVVKDGNELMLVDKKSIKVFEKGFESYKGENGKLRKEFVSGLVDHFASEAEKASAELALATNNVAKIYTDSLDSMRARNNGARPTEGVEAEAYNNMLALLEPISAELFKQYAE